MDKDYVLRYFSIMMGVFKKRYKISISKEKL